MQETIVALPVPEGGTKEHAPPLLAVFSVKSQSVKEAVAVATRTAPPFPLIWDLFPLKAQLVTATVPAVTLKAAPASLATESPSPKFWKRRPIIFVVPDIERTKPLEPYAGFKLHIAAVLSHWIVSAIVIHAMRVVLVQGVPLYTAVVPEVRVMVLLAAAALMAVTMAEVRTLTEQV